jgi:hypothetical protein
LTDEGREIGGAIFTGEDEVGRGLGFSHYARPMPYRGICLGSCSEHRAWKAIPQKPLGQLGMKKPETNREVSRRLASTREDLTWAASFRT